MPEGASDLQPTTILGADQGGCTVGCRGCLRRRDSEGFEASTRGQSLSFEAKDAREVSKNKGAKQ